MKRISKCNAWRGEDYALWAMRFEAVLESRELLEIVLRDVREELSQSELTAEKRLKMAKARSLLVQGLGDRPLRSVIGERRDPAQMYAKLNEQ